MKKQRRIGIKIISGVLISGVLFVMGGNAIQAENGIQTNTEKSQVIRKLEQGDLDYTQDYKKWLSLSREEKEAHIEPDHYGTPYESKVELFVNENTLAEKFDLREHISIKVKDQMQTQSCWTFPMTSEVETNISLTRGYTSPIFSARHMEYMTAKTFLNGINVNGYNREVGSGGNSTMGLSYFTSGLGPVLEKDMPFENSEDKVNLEEINKPVGQKIENYTKFPSIYKEIENGVTIYKDNKGNTLTNSEVEAIRRQIKEHITNYGGVSTNTNSSQLQYFNTNAPTLATAYYCNNNDIIQDHLVTIIGWDDTYSKDNFNSICKPSKDGAWLVLNSYGKGFNQGYYYISYEDVMVERQTTGIITVSDRNYKNLYQYDILSNSINFSPKVNGSSDSIKEVYMANVYTRKEIASEILQEVAITGAGGTHTADIYVNETGDLDISNSTLVASEAIILDGYNTIKLNQGITLSSEKFAIIVKYKNPQEVTIAVEANLTANGITDEGSEKWDTATANKGEGLISVTGEQNSWQDITDIVTTGSLCIKAFTTVNETVGPEISFEPNGSTVYKLEQSSNVTVTDENEVNESTLRYVWSQNPEQPLSTEFESCFTNKEKISNSTDTGNNWYLWVRAKDMLGNESYARSEAFYLDNTPPTTPTITSNVVNNEYTNKDANIFISGSTALSGIVKYEYTLDDGKTWLDINNALTITEDGIYKIKARATSGTGLISELSEEYIIKVDKTPPTVKGVEEGKKYNLVIPEITDQNEITAVLNKDGEEKAYTIDSENRGDAINETGNYTLTVTDKVGNQTILHFIIDADPPAITITPNGNANYQMSQATTVHITDANNIDATSLKYIWTQGIEYVTEYMFEEGATEFSNGDTITKNDGSGKYNLLIIAKDEFGNVALFKSEPFYMDNERPTPPIIHSNVGNGGITNKAVKVTIDGSTSQSGIKKYQYSLDGGTNWNDIAEGEEILFTESKQYNLITRAVNNLDVIGDVSEEYVVIINTSVPNITFAPNGSQVYKKQHTTQIQISHTSEVDQESFRYVWSQSETVPEDSEFIEQFYMLSDLEKNTGSGIWYVWAKATDRLGNTAVTKSEAFYFDNEKPTAPTINSNAPNGQFWGETAQVSISGSESPSGIKKYKYSIDNKVTWNEQVEVSFEEDGTYTIYACAVNNVGTTGEIAGPYVIKIDRTAPKVTQVEENGIYSEVLPVIEDDSPVNIILIKDGQEIPYEEGTKITENGEYTLKVTDELGHETIVNFMVDVAGPTITFSPNGNTTWEKVQSTKVTITDPSGVDASTVRYKWTQSIQELTEETFMPDSIPFTSEDTITKNTDSGDNWYLWVLAKDVKGNMSLVKTANFCLDNETPEAPTITATVPSGEYSREDVTISISGSESPSGIAKYQYSLDNGLNWVDLAITDKILANKTGTYNIKARAVNNVGTIGKQTEEAYIVRIDKDGPIVTFTPNGNATYAKKQATTVNVNSVGTLSTLKYLWSTKAQDLQETEFESSFNNKQTIEKDTESGTWYLWVLAKDSYNSQAITRSEAFLLDNEIPTAPNLKINAEDGSSINHSLEIEISGSSSPSGIAKYQYSLNNGEDWIDVAVGQKVIVDIAGYYQIKARAVNNVGTLGVQTESYEVTITKSALTVAFVPKENQTYQRQHSTQVIIGGSSQLTTLKYLWTTKEENVQESEITQDFTNKQTMIKNTESGTWYLWILVEDNIGNKIIKKSGKFNLDNEKPTAPTISKQTQEGGEKVTIEISGSTALSGIEKYQYSLNDGITWEDIAVGENLVLNQQGEYQLKARAISGVGIPGTQTETQEISIKTRIPSIIFKPNGNNNYQNTQSTIIEVSSNFDIKPETQKYIWSTQEEGITQEDFMVQIRSNTDEKYTYTNKQTLSKNTQSGIWYIWAYAENVNGDSKVQRSEAFYLDNDNPIITGVDNEKIYHKGVTPVITDDTSNVTTVVMKDGIAYSYTKGDTIEQDGVYQITAVDEAGNMSNVTFVMQYKEDDTTGPIVNFEPNGNKKYATEQSTKVTVTDPSGVKEESLKYLWSKETDKPKEEDFSEAFKNGDVITNHEETGKVYLWIYAEDNNGNKSILRSNEFYLDNTRPNKPSISSNIKDGGTTDKEVIITIQSERKESEIHYEYSTDGGKTWEKIDGNTIKIKEEGTKNLLIIAVNETGLRSEIVSFNCTIKKMVSKPTDNTTAPGKIPQTGIYTIILITIVALVGMAIILFIKIRNLEERKG